MALARLFLGRAWTNTPTAAIGCSVAVNRWSSTAANLNVYTTVPKQPSTPKRGQLPFTAVQKYFDEGFLIVPDFFHPEELSPVLDAVAGQVDSVANKLYKTGRIKELHKFAPVGKRLTLIEQQFKGASVLLHKEGILPKAYQELWADERLLNVAEQFIGPNISGHPVWNLRPKTPSNEQATVPWHQDNAYLEPDCIDTLQVTAWIPLVDATSRNGCMQVLRGGHRAGVTAAHTCCAGDTWYVEIGMDEMEKSLGVSEKDIVVCEVPRGGVLFMNNAIPHRSTENFSDNIRWSLDLRWQDTSKPHGFFLKECVEMRRSSDPNFKIPWDEFAGINRTQLQMGGPAEPADTLEDDYFDTAIAGPWMKRWEITNPNRHTRKLDCGEVLNWHKS